MQFVFCLFERFSNLCLANAVEPLRAANTLSGKPLYSWRYTGLEAGFVRSSSDLAIAVEADLWTQPKDEHALVLVSSYGYHQHASRLPSSAFRQRAAVCQQVLALDTGAWLLAHTGMLDGKQATIHWDELDAFAEKFSAVEVQPLPWVSDGRVTTCAGGRAAFDMMLEVIEDQHGTMLRLDVEGLFQRDMRAAPQPEQRFSTKHHLASRAMRLMRQTVEEPLALDAIAARLELSPKSLERCFAQVLGTTPGQVYKHLRLSKAQSLAASGTMPMAEIAVRCGYSSASSLARAYRQEFGVTLRKAA